MRKCASKSLAALLALCVVLTLLSTTAFAAEEKKEENIRWSDVEVPSGWRLGDASYVKEFGILSCWLIDEEYDYSFINIELATGKQTDRYGDYFIHPFSCGRAMIVKADPDHDVMYGYMDTAGNVVIAPEYYVARPFFEGYAAVEDNTGGYAYIDVNGEKVFTADKYSQFYDTDFHNGIAVVGSYAVIDKNLEYIVEPGVYEYIDKFYDGMAVVTDQNSKKGLINDKGEVVLPCAYDQLYYDGAAELICVGNRDGNRDLKFGYVDLKGNVVIPLKYDRADSFSDGLAYVETYQDGNWYDAKCEFIDSTGKTVLAIGDLGYEEWSTEFQNGLLCVSKAVDVAGIPVSMFTLIDKTGKEVFPWVRGDSIRLYDNGVYGAGDWYDDSFSALYDTEGNKIISNEDINYAKALTEENQDEIVTPEIIVVADGKLGWFRYPENFGEEDVTGSGFTDVPANAYYTDAVTWAVENKITTGVTSASFAPDKNCTRAEIVTFLWRAKGKPEPTVSENPFTDVSPDSFAYKAILWALEKGITTGTSATTFDPNGTCTRAEAVTFQWRAAEKPTASGGSAFTDVPANTYYTDAVKWAVENKITTGVTGASFAPGKDCTRAEVVTFLWRDLDK